MKFTRTERRMMEILADGLPHSRRELHACLPDELGALKNIWTHLSRIRKKVRLKGEEIVCVIHNRTVHYRLVRLVANARKQSIA